MEILLILLLMVMWIVVGIVCLSSLPFVVLILPLLLDLALIYGAVEITKIVIRIVVPDVCI